MATTARLLSALAALSLAACAEDAARCVPGMAVSCACAGDRRGAQTCAADGTYEACRCDAPAPDASPPADAATPDVATPDAAAPDALSSPDAPAPLDVAAPDAPAPLDAPAPDARPDASATPDATTTPDVAVPDAPAGGGLAAYVTAAQFEAMFPHRGDAASGCEGGYYTYAAFLEAARAFPAFAAEGTDAQRRRELAAFLANIAHETTGGWATAPGGPEAWGLCFREEVGCRRAAPPGCAYCTPSAEWPCAAGQRYFGRGPIQLSYNFNYGQAGRALGLDLLANPDLVSSDGAVAFKTALWFWMTTQSPKPSCHDVMTGRWTPSAADLAAGRRPGFGMTINVINGGVECGYALSSPSAMTPANVADRIRFYASFTSRLGATQGDVTDCGAMHPY